MVVIPDHGASFARDFSRWGCRALVRVGVEGEEKMIMPNPEKVWPQGISNHERQNMRTLGDSFVTCTVGDSHKPLGRAMDLRFVHEEFDSH